MSDDIKPAMPTIPDNAPWWAKGIMVVGHTFGVSAILLGFYLGQSAGLIPNPVESELENIKKELQELKGATLQGTASIKGIVTAMEEQNRRGQIRCVLKAKTDEEKKACLQGKDL